MKTKTCQGESWFFIIVLIVATLLIVNDAKESDIHHEDIENDNFSDGLPCDEFYIVKEGETLNSIAEKCDDPLILLSNPHINGFEDIFPGVLLIINPHYD
jgi:hypothetical protein